MPIALSTIRINHDEDVVVARQRAGHIGALLGYEAGEQTRIATAVSGRICETFASSVFITGRPSGSSKTSATD